jgi:hypothetical protein
MKFIFTIFIFLNLILLNLVSVMASNDIQHINNEKYLCFQPCSVALIGKVQIENKYGPPGYGENPSLDERVVIYVLKLKTPVNFRDSPNGVYEGDTIENVKFIQLAYGPKIKNYTKFTDHIVRVTGQVYESESASFYTRVFMAVTTVNDIKMKNYRKQVGEGKINDVRLDCP